jgi:hypothetical protein
MWIMKRFRRNSIALLLQNSDYTVHRSLLLIPILLFGCQQLTTKETSQANGSMAAATETPFKLVSGNVKRNSAIFEQSGVTASFANTAGMQVIHITRQGKLLINYMRAIDSTATVIPVPYLIITGTDTSVGIKAATMHFFFRIKDNKATYTKMVDAVK